MDSYLGVKLIQAEPMTDIQFNVFKKGAITEDFGGVKREGYKVVYPDGYVSWSPKAVFEEAYRRTDGLSFGLAIEAMKKGYKVARVGWNGKGMFIVLMPELKLPPHSCQKPGAKVTDRTAKYIGEDTPLDSRPYFAMWTALKQWQPGWLASQADMLAEDWEIVA